MEATSTKVRVRFSEGVPDVWDALPNSEYDGRVWDNKEFTREEARQIFQELDDLHRELFPDEPYGPYIKPAVPVKKTTFVPLSKRNEFG